MYINCMICTSSLFFIEGNTTPCYMKYFLIFHTLIYYHWVLLYLLSYSFFSTSTQFITSLYPVVQQLSSLVFLMLRRTSQTRYITKWDFPYHKNFLQLVYRPMFTSDKKKEKKLTYLLICILPPFYKTLSKNDDKL